MCVTKNSNYRTPVNESRQVIYYKTLVDTSAFKEANIYHITYSDNRSHYTISQSAVWYNTQLTNHSLTTVIVFRCRNYTDNRTHYTISQSTVWYDTQLTNDSLTTLIVFRCRNYPDSFFSYVHLFSEQRQCFFYMRWLCFRSNRLCVCELNKHGGHDFLS